MTTRKRRDSIQRAIVVLQGDKVSSEKMTGLAPLLRASKYVRNSEDEILVLILLSADGSGPSSSKGFYGDRRCNDRCHKDPYDRFLREEISLKKEDFRGILRPFHERCKSIGVKFQVKMAAGFDPKDIITEEANNAGATWIILDSSFARHLTFRLIGAECNVSLVTDPEEDTVHDCSFAMDEPEAESFVPMEVTHNPKSPKLRKGPTLTEEPSVCHRPSTSRESEQENESPRQVEQTRARNVPSSKCIGTRVSVAGFRVEKPHELSWEVILQITKGFSTRAWNHDPENNYSTHIGSFQHHPVLVQRLLACSRSILKAEKRAALCMHQKNIMVLTAYHQGENGIYLIFPLLRGMTSLDRYIWGPESRELKFHARLKIAISIAEGVRYMHEECPQGAVVHGDLQPRKILLGSNLHPMIYGFGRATWIQYEQASLNTKKRSFVKEASVHESIDLVKKDVLQFGVLLLRLFCRSFAPEDDKSLIQWARPLLLKRKFHELLEEDSDFSDMHGIYRVMAVATACTRTKPISRPYMNLVINRLKGEQFCAMQTSPSESSF